MTESRKVRTGEHLTRLANQHGFRSFAPIWDDPENRSLRATRVTPHILADQDTVSIPPLNLREVDRPTDQRHRFRAELHPIVVRLVFTHWDDRPVDEAPTEVLLDGKTAPFTAGAKGTLDVPVTALNDRCRVNFAKSDVTARIGFLQPIATPAGVRLRLENLGYFPGDNDDPKKIAFRSAIEEFQCDHKLLIDGKIGPQVRSALLKVHGC